MKILRRVLIAIATLVSVLAAIRWGFPIAVSFYAARKAPAIARITPNKLQDQTVSQAPGARLSYVGYEFEVPWADLDGSKTALYPKDKPDKSKAILTFKSGLKLAITTPPAREYAAEFATDFKWSARTFEAVFGSGTAKSDYAFVNNVYRFTPNRMHHWSLSDGVHYRETTMLIIKSIIPTKAAESGIFEIENQNYKGFQQGDPRTRQDSLIINLYADDGSCEIAFQQKNYQSLTGVTQPEINRIIQSLHRIAPAGPLEQR
jgi:hypothetical protein